MPDALAKLTLPSSSIRRRRATGDDLPATVGLLVDDPLGSTREAASGADDLRPYVTALDAIDADPAQLLVVATDGIEAVATMQLSFIPGLARHGALRAQVEAVRVAASHRSRGLGAAMFRWAIDEARRRGCALFQLTTDKTRTDAHRFYERLGFTASHRVSSCSSDRSARFNEGSAADSRRPRARPRVSEAVPSQPGGLTGQGSACGRLGAWPGCTNT
jgi:GNAT superfamily N-acetyltransferase